MRSCLDFDDARDDGDGDGPLAPRGAELVLGDHRGGVNCVGWESPDAVWSGGDDKTLKRWDAESGACTQSFDAPKAVASLAVRADGARVLWCGGGDKGVHAWDPRAGQTTGGITTFASHQVRHSFFRGYPVGFFLRFLLFARRDGRNARRASTRDVGDETFLFPTRGFPRAGGANL